MTVRPTGTVAHLVERGVSATFQQRVGARSKTRITKTVTLSSGKAISYSASPSYQRTLTIAPLPFFTPAVAAVGGAAGVNARLQGRIDAICAELNRGTA